MKIEMKKIDDIKPYKNNPRKNEKTIKKLMDLLESGEVPFDVPIVIDRDNVIVKGHSRWNALKNLGVKEIPCIISLNDDETNAKDRITDNAVQDLSKWKPEELSIELRELDINIEGFALPNLQSTMYSNSETDYTTLYNSGISESAVDSSIERMLGIAEEKKEELIEWTCDECGETFYISRREVEQWGK